jgi:hypothetical protein
MAIASLGAVTGKRTYAVGARPRLSRYASAYDPWLAGASFTTYILICTILFSSIPYTLKARIELWHH